MAIGVLAWKPKTYGVWMENRIVEMQRNVPAKLFPVICEGYRLDSIVDVCTGRRIEFKSIQLNFVEHTVSAKLYNGDDPTFIDYGG